MAKKVSGKLAAAVERTSGPQLAPTTMKVDADRERKYRAECALRTMKDYQKLCSDKPLMKEAKKLAKDEMKKLSKIV